MSQRMISSLALCAILVLSTAAEAQRPRRNGAPPKPRTQEEPARQKLPIFLSSEDSKAFQVLPDPEGFALEEFIMAWCDATGMRISWQQRVLSQSPKIHLSSVVMVPAQNLDFWCQSMLCAQGYMLIPVGPSGTKSFSLERTDSSRRLKSSNTWIEASEAAVAAANPARVYSTVIQLKHIEVQSTRGALQGLVANRATTSIGEIKESNSMHIIAPGDTLYSIVRAIKSFDKPLPEEIRKAKEVERQRIAGPVRRK